MKLYLIRHGEAGDGFSDAQRALTEQGRSDSQNVFNAHQEDCRFVDLVIHSPYLRAQQSAEILSDFCPAAASMTASELTPETPIQHCLQYLQALQIPPGDSVALVGHNPLFSSLLNRLLGKADGYYHLGTSGAAALSMAVMEANCAELIWLEPGF